MAKVISGKWGDDYPAVRLVGTSSLDQKAEAYMEQITYGEISPETAEANAKFIVRACNSHEELLEALRWLVNTCCDVGKSGEPPTMNEHIEAIEAGKAAIAKAEGC